MFRRFHPLQLTALLLSVLPALHGQTVFTYPGPQSPFGQYIDVYDIFTGQPRPNTSGHIMLLGAFKVLARNDGTEFYALGPNYPFAEAFGQALGNKIMPIGSFNGAVTSGVLSPDESKLIIGEAAGSSASTGAVAILDTHKFATHPRGGIPIPNSTTVVDVATSYDGTVAYALGVNGSQSFLVSIDTNDADAGAAEYTITNTMTLDGVATSMTLGYNGLLYIMLPNQILEINPLAMAITPLGIINLPNFNPGRPAFNPQTTLGAGNYMLVANQLAANQIPAAGDLSVVLIDLNAHGVIGTLPFSASFVDGNGAYWPITQMAFLNDLTAYALIEGTASLYTLQIGLNGGIILGVPSLPSGVTNTGVVGFNFSPDLGSPTRNEPQYVFIVTNSNVYYFDPVTLTLAGTIILQDSLQYSVLYTVNTPTDPPPTVNTVLTYGNNQTIPLGGTSLPLVIRALDANGYPIPFASVTYSGATGNATVTGLPATNPQTGYTGFAEGYFTGGSTTTDIGTQDISATVSDNNGGSASANFAITVGTPIPASPTTFQIYSGQGQVIAIDPTGVTPPDTVQPLTVLALDPNGMPLPGVEVTFTAYTGTLNQAVYTAVTGTNGQASVTPTAPPLALGPPGFETESVVASAGGLSVTFYVTTVEKTSATVTGPPLCTNPSGCIEVPPVLAPKVLSPAAGTVITGNAGATLTNTPIQVQVTSAQTGTPVPNVGVLVSTGTNQSVANTTCMDPSGSGVALTNSMGIATCILVLNHAPGTLPLNVYVPAVAPSNPQDALAPLLNIATLTINPDPVASLSVVSGNDVGIIELNGYDPTVEVMDSSGNPITGATVTWTYAPLNALSFNLSSALTTTTDSNGQTSLSLVAAQVDGPATVTATSGSASVTLNLTIGPAAASIAVNSGDNQTANENTAFAQPLSVTVLDSNKKAAPYAPLMWTLPASVTVVGTLPYAADINGMSTINVMAGATPGNAQILVQQGNNASATFTLVILPNGPTNVQVLNAASFASGVMVSGSTAPIAIAPGSLISLFGQNVTSSITAVTTDPATLADYSVLIDGDYSAPISVIAPNQINAQIPFEIPAGVHSLTVRGPLGSATVSQINITPEAPAIFSSGTVTSNGTAYPQATVIRSDGSYASSTNPVQPGETIMFFATGLGQTIPTAITGLPGIPGQLVAAPVYCGINGKSINVVSAVYTANTTGLYTITAQVPTTATPGPAEPLSLILVDPGTGTSYAAPPVYIAVQ